MKRFGGFPVGMSFTAVPEAFLSHVLPDISDIGELKATLTFFRLLYRKRGHLRFVGHRELAADVALMKGLAENDENEDAQSALVRALDLAVERGTLLRMTVDREGVSEDIYFMNAEADRRTVARIESGETILPGLAVKEFEVVGEAGNIPDIFSLYEANIGMITPMIAEELRGAQKVYPESWIKEAIGEAANQNKRKWSYISAILERWNSEGKTDGTYRRNPKTADPDKYIKGKYGHMVQR